MPGTEKTYKRCDDIEGDNDNIGIIMQECQFPSPYKTLLSNKGEQYFIYPLNAILFVFSLLFNLIEKLVCLFSVLSPTYVLNTASLKDKGLPW